MNAITSNEPATDSSASVPAPPTGPRIIRQLPPQLVNQIAAGEVIERPASVVKELLENSIDAGASRVELTIAGGGVEMIRISDDGCGMTADQLPLAVTSHATSKLPEDDSLFHVGTLGFRGEALASIASVSQMTIRSRAEGTPSGSQIDIRGGVIESPGPCGCPVGTTIEVRNLFFNTPVRRKFLKTPQTERGHIVEAFTRLALANPKVHFVLRNGDKEMFDLLPTPRWADRIEAFFGTEISESLILIESDDAQVKIFGFACDPAVSRGNNRMQYLFLNGRHIRDRALQHALGEAYRGLLMVGRHPVCFLRMTMPPEMIDVNVHPAKLEVRFTDSGRVYSRLLQTLRQRFLSTDMTHRVSSAPAPEPVTGDALRSRGESVMGMPAREVDGQRQAVIDWARTGRDAPRDQSISTTTHRIDSSLSPATTAHTTALGGAPEFRPFGGDVQHAPTRAPWDGDESTGNAPIPPGSVGAQDRTGDNAESASGGDAQPSTMQSVGGVSPSVCYLGFQVHNRYLVTQDDKGMVVIDQHALHERVLYERVCKKVLGENGSLEAQRLLVPEPVSLTPAERVAALEVKETLARIGLEIEDFGGETILIQSYPAIMPNKDPAEMLRTILESVMGAGRDPNPYDLLNHLLSTVACKAAVKAGDPLSPEEIVSLLEQKDLYQDTHHCPHGRPTALFFSRDELDRMFGRLGPRGRVTV
ncbi:DNA mismatch repair endonuclease MutL [Allorhodopirellula heiligendammensis]|uniref:DNA mismatch repair protein MutL n=1 Tax=Allorhodopirellula heiligendammensis TaxID=2714739 RepID=A0A5C6BFB8_9BACT|nr:DNA mismatch repair endonuclease MutL [Allorhodopirellula heiligendammensis]TWU10432.1 DNA mismatch repair protein MutL [Allorhodopirellula heiligendammensis]